MMNATTHARVSVPWTSLDPEFVKQQKVRLRTLQKGLCYLCHEKLGGDAELEHKVPVTRGGGLTDEDNLGLAHPRCNKIKANLTPEEFFAGAEVKLRKSEFPHRVVTFLSDRQMNVLKKLSQVSYGTPISALVRRAVEEFCKKQEKK